MEIKKWNPVELAYYVELVNELKENEPELTNIDITDEIQIEDLLLENSRLYILYFHNKFGHYPPECDEPLFLALMGYNEDEIKTILHTYYGNL